MVLYAMHSWLFSITLQRERKLHIIYY